MAAAGLACERTRVCTLMEDKFNRQVHAQALHSIAMDKSRTSSSNRATDTALRGCLVSAFMVRSQQQAPRPDRKRKASTLQHDCSARKAHRYAAASDSDTQTSPLKERNASPDRNSRTAAVARHPHRAMSSQTHRQRRIDDDQPHSGAPVAARPRRARGVSGDDATAGLSGDDATARVQLQGVFHLKREHAVCLRPPAVSDSYPHLNQSLAGEGRHDIHNTRRPSFLAAE